MKKRRKYKLYRYDTRLRLDAPHKLVYQGKEDSYLVFSVTKRETQYRRKQTAHIKIPIERIGENSEIKILKWRFNIIGSPLENLVILEYLGKTK